MSAMFLLYSSANCIPTHGALQRLIWYCKQTLYLPDPIASGVSACLQLRIG